MSTASLIGSKCCVFIKFKSNSKLNNPSFQKTEFMNRLIFLFFLLHFTVSYSKTCPDTCEYFIPNTLTPDCDQAGCEFLEVVSNCSFIKFELIIYNKWAEVVFNSTSSQNKFNCIGHKDGAYIWKLTGEFCNSKIINDTGTFLIIN